MTNLVNGTELCCVTSKPRLDNAMWLRGFSLGQLLGESSVILRQHGETLCVKGLTPQIQFSKH